VDPEPGEEVFFHGHPSWRSLLSLYIKGLLIGIVVGVIVGVITRATGKSVNVGLVVVAVIAVLLVVMAIAFFRLIRTTYSITSQRLTINKGLLSRDLHETRIDRVQNVNYRQSLLERMLGIGDVDFDTAGGDDYDFSFLGVADPHGIVRTVDRAIRQMPTGRGTQI
jgi:uncharacterized membrane protein YdbT with pleckstrin-like domain